MQFSIAKYKYKLSYTYTFALDSIKMLNGLPTAVIAFILVISVDALNMQPLQGTVNLSQHVYMLLNV